MILTKLGERSCRAWEGGARRAETVQSADNDLAAREKKVQEKIAEYRDRGVTWKGMTHRCGSRNLYVPTANRRVFCVELKRTFKDCEEVVTWLRQNGHPTARPGNIRQAMVLGFAGHGFHWRRPGQEFIQFRIKRAIPVRCVTTGRSYPMIAVAAKEDVSAMGVNYAAAHRRISRAADSGTPDPMGRTWEFLSKEAA